MVQKWAAASAAIRCRAVDRLPPSLPLSPCPAPCAAGKSSLAQQLASRLNMPNVLQTDVLYEVGGVDPGLPVKSRGAGCMLCTPWELRAGHAGTCGSTPAAVSRRATDSLTPAPRPPLQLLRASGTGDLPAEPLWRRPLPPGASLVGEFQRECATIRRALDGDLNKASRSVKELVWGDVHGVIRSQGAATWRVAVPTSPWVQCRTPASCLSPPLGSSFFCHTPFFLATLLPLATRSASATANPSSLRACTSTQASSCASAAAHVATPSCLRRRRQAAWSWQAAEGRQPATRQAAEQAAVMWRRRRWAASCKGCR
mgnify:CR=1 FL=1